MEFNDRLKEMLNELGIKRVELAKSLGISEAAVSMLCSGKNKPSGQTVSLICKTYAVNEKWLLTGEGEMKTHSKEDALANLAMSILDMDKDSDRYRFIMKLNSILAQMTDEEMQKVLNFIHELSDSTK